MQAPSSNHSTSNSATNSPVQTINSSNSSSIFNSNNVNSSTTNNTSNSSSRTTTPTAQQQQQQIIAKPKRHGLSLGMSLAMGNTMSATLDKMREAMPNTPSYALDKMREAMPHVNSLQSASQVSCIYTIALTVLLVLRSIALASAHCKLLLYVYIATNCQHAH
jgi:hypothetical protein